MSLGIFKAIKAITGAITEVAEAAESGAKYVNNEAKHQLTKQAELHKQELENKLYLREAAAEQLVEIKELEDNLDADVKAALDELFS